MIQIEHFDTGAAVKNGLDTFYWTMMVKSHKDPLFMTAPKPLEFMTQCH